LEKKKAPPGKAIAVKPEEEKKSSTGKLILILVLTLLLIGLIVGVVLCYINDWFGLRTSIVDFFIGQDELYSTRLAQLDQREAELLARETSLSEVALQQQEIAAQQQAEQQRLDAMLADIQFQDQELSSRITAFDNSIIEFDQLVDTLAAMDSANAAAVLEGLWPLEDAARILSSMEPATAASILDEMTTEGARSIAEVLVLMSQ